MSDDPPVDFDDRLGRLERLAQKVENGEELTEEEKEQVEQDIEAMKTALDAMVEAIVPPMNRLANNLSDAMQPIVEFAEEHDLEELEEDDDAQ